MTLLRHFPFTWILITGMLVVVYACEDSEKPDEFFQRAEFDHNFFATFDLQNPDSVVWNIQERVPAKWQNLACEGAYYWMTSIHQSVSDSLQLALLDAYDVAFPSKEVAIFTGMIRGELLTKQYALDSAMIELRKSLELAQEINNAIRAKDIRVGMANLEARRYNYPVAINFLLDAYNYFRDLPYTLDRGRRIEAMRDLGECYLYNKDYTEAHEWFGKLWTYGNRHNLKGPKIISALALANTYLYRNKPDSAEVFLDTAHHFINLYTDHNYDEAFARYVHGKVLTEKNTCQKAVATIREAINQISPSNYVFQKYRYHKALADAFACSGQLDSALHYYQYALQSPDSVLHIDIQYAISEVYQMAENYEQALVHTEWGNALYQKLFNSTKVKEVGYLIADFEHQQRLQEMAFKQSRRTFIIVIILLLLFMLAILYTFVLYRQRQRTILLKQEKEKIAALQRIQKLELKDTQEQLHSTSSALQHKAEELALRNEMLAKLELRLAELKQKHSRHIPKDIKILTQKDWEQFQQTFEADFPGSIDKLKENYQQLSTGDIRLAMLVKIGFGSKKISDILGISAESVYKNRYRLRKKLKLDRETDLEAFIRAQL